MCVCVRARACVLYVCVFVCGCMGVRVCYQCLEISAMYILMYALNFQLKKRFDIWHIPYITVHTWSVQQLHYFLLYVDHIPTFQLGQ